MNNIPGNITEKLYTDMSDSTMSSMNLANLTIDPKDYQIIMNNLFNELIAKATYHKVLPKRSSSDIGKVIIKCPSCQGKGHITQGH